MRTTIYVTDDDQTVCAALSRRLTKKGHLVRSFDSGASLLEAVKYEVPDLLFLDLKMPDMDGLETLRRVRQTIPQTLVVMLTAYGSVEDAVEAMRLGAYDFLIKSVDFSSVEPALNRALNYLTLSRRLEYTTSEQQRQYAWDHVIANNSAMATVRDTLQQLVSQGMPVLFLQGEVGTGKEFLARVVHYNSPQQLGAFVPLRCTELTGPLLEHQLWGYERGAFDGANQAGLGAIEYADGGTLFIDAIELLPLPVQKTLAQALRTGFYGRLGGHDRLPLNTRLIVASAFLENEPGQEPAFHPALLAQLRDHQVSIPPLRDRKEDILPLAMKTLQAYGEEIGRPKIDIEASMLPHLHDYPFPGNIRELEALIKQAALCSHGPVLSAQDFHFQKAPTNEQPSSPNSIHLQFELGRQSLADIQRIVIHEVLRLSNQDKEQAARYLHVSPETLEK